jgi:hypothetical protein
MSLKERILHQSVRRLTRFAASLALAGLAIICFSIIFPRPLPVVLSMSVGQGIGIAAFFCYLLAVVLDASRSARTADSLAPPARASDDGGSTGKS